MAVVEDFRGLHHSGTFVMPNAWDIGSARILAGLGFPALATTSSGHAASLGKRDQQVTLDELLVHAEQLAAAVDVPLSIDAERCFADTPAGVAETVSMLAETGAAGCSIEDFDPATGAIDELDVATERVAAAADAAHRTGMVLTARCENLLYGLPLDDAIVRLVAYRDAGADVVYAPGLVAAEDIRRVVLETATPVNMLALPGAPSVADLGELGALRTAAYGNTNMPSFGW